MPLTLRVPLLGDCTDEASRRPAAAIESLDYEQATNQVFLRKQKRQEAGSEQRHLYGYSGSTATKVAATFLSGIAIGLSAATLQAGVSLACRYRNHLLASLFQGSGTLGGGTAVRYVADSLQGLPLVFLCMLGISVTAVWLVTLVVFYHSPKASGGGVASVMALLNGNAIDGLLSGRVYVTKLLGTATSRMAGLALGVEGPMIHLGACLASMVCHAEHVLYRRFNLHRRHPRDKAEQAPAASNDFLFSNSDHRELVSAGAAAGLAAAFGAPIGGVLFAIEEATSVWSRKLAWRCFLCASVACFTLAVLHPRSQTGMLSFRGITALTNVQWLIQLPLLTIVSACGGLLGSAFNIGKSRTLSWRKKHQGISWRLLEGASVAALTSAALIWLPAAVGSCLPLPDEWDAADVIRHNCGEGQYNDLATGLLSSSVWVIKSLLSLGSDAEPVNNRLCSIAVPCYYSALSLGVLSVTYLLLFLLASNLIVPGGLFMPCIMVGSSFGVLLGLLLRQLLPAWWSIQPGVYAVVCATAMLGAVFRSSISLVAIMIEGTRGIDMLFGIILATIVSNLVAHHVHPNGLYESELEVDSKGGTCYYLRQEPPHALRSQAAEAVMASPVVGLAPLERVSTVLSVLSGTSHNGFPVLVAAKQHHLQHQQQHQHQHQRQQHDGSTASAGRSSGMLQGLVLRSQLLVLLRHGAFCDERGRYISVPVQQSVAGFEEALGCEMEAASQASASGYRSSSSGSGPEESHGMLGELGPAPSMGIGGGGFPSLDRSRGTAAMPEADVLQAAGAAVEREVEAGRQAYLNLTPFMHLAPITVRPHTPADRVHHLFLALSLRHLCVVDWHSRCLGIITRKDLDHAAGSGWWRATHIAPTPHQSPRAGSRSVLDGSSPQAGWTQSFVRSLAVPPRRLMAALQTAFSPATRSPVHADVRGEAGDATPLVPAGRPAAASADPAIGFRLLRHAMSEPAHALLRGVDQQATHDAQAAADVEQQL